MKEDAGEVSDWLDDVLEEGGWKCAACGHWRLLKEREIEPCICGDDGFDIYEADIASRWLP